MSYSRKRRRGSKEIDYSPQPQLSWLPSSSEAEPQLDKALSTLYVEAHEADIVHGKQHVALMLEPPESGANTPQKGEKGCRLVKRTSNNELEGVCWLDRYDARLLLSSAQFFRDTLPVESVDPPSPSGWSDLPSDVEDTFFFVPSEVEGIQRSKRRKLLENAQEARLKALRERGDPDGYNSEDQWGGSDEEPTFEQAEFMSRTATHILASPNPMQLEARILANHGSDKRFAFLKGRWKRRWIEIKRTVNAEKEKKEANAKNSTIPTAIGGLVGLGAYGDSDGESNTSEQSQSICAIDEDTLKAARRARAREWTAKRRIDRGQNVDSK